MSKFSGFVPFQFKKAGYTLLVVGGICLLLVGVVNLTGWFEIPQAVLFFGLVSIPISLYLIFVPPEE
jgi:hypothetical protein